MQDANISGAELGRRCELDFPKQRISQYKTGSVKITPQMGKLFQYVCTEYKIEKENEKVKTVATL